MRKFIVLFLLTVCVACSAGCKKDLYAGNISELRQDIYAGNAQNATITAYYGFRETPFKSDGVVSDKIYGFTFKLDVIPDEIKRSVEFSDENKTYRADFALDDITSEYKAFIEVNKHFDKGFTVDLICGANAEKVTLLSIVPNNSIDHLAALRALSEKQRALFDAYTVDGKFQAEIYMRIFVKDDRPYWYIAITPAENKLKAMLIDGSTGELLAIKDIF
ncbi:MAG: hypothetical protein J5911_00550 [Clostridia bacterium]|nr:hypothetical protein [Clostridia bacterium]